MEKKEELLRKKEEKHKELEKLRGTTKEQLWLTDLDEFMEKLQEVEEKEREDAAAGIISGKAAKKGFKKGIKEEAKPSPHGIRIEPKIPAELRTKAAKAAAAKDRKTQKVAKKLENDLEDEKDEFDMMVTDKEANRRLSDKLGYTPEKKKPAVKKEPKASPVAKKGKKNNKNPWDSDSDSDAELKSSGDESFEVEKKDRGGIRRNAATTKYKDYMSGSNSDSDDSFTVTDEKKNGVSCRIFVL